MTSAAGRSYLYGPVPSRRLGFSLGIDIIPWKTCSMDCVYCQLGGRPATFIRRGEFAPVDDVLAQIKEALASGVRIDALTFSGSGEPTLHSGLGRIILGLKRMTDIPVVVLTNASTLTRPGVRKDLAEADIVVPSLDGATEGVFRRINRPHGSLRAARIIDGLAAFRRRFRGQIWLEILFVKGLNDGPGHLRALRRAIARIEPDRVQINTVIRPPAESSARPLGRRELDRIRDFLGGAAEVIADVRREGRRAGSVDLMSLVPEVLRRRPETAGGIARALEAAPSEVRAACRTLVSRGVIRSIAHGNRVYYQPAAGREAREK